MIFEMHHRLFEMEQMKELEKLLQQKENVGELIKAADVAYHKVRCSRWVQLTILGRVDPIHRGQGALRHLCET